MKYFFFFFINFIINKYSDEKYYTVEDINGFKCLLLNRLAGCYGCIKEFKESIKVYEKALGFCKEDKYLKSECFSGIGISYYF